MGKQATVLLVDDDPDFVEATKVVLESKYRVIVAYNGEDGLKNVVAEKPDLVILDVVMPGRNGFEICKELKTAPKYHSYCKIPVIMLTVYPDDREKARLTMFDGMIMEADEYLQKPVAPTDLLRQVEGLLK
ncbi:MAG: response regulator [Nitrososphaerota archaeon]|nr:response regulator [Nitrososphaerota archaeon]